MAKIKILTARGVESAPVGFHSDGGNLYLRVRDGGSRAWVFRYARNGLAVEIGLGPVESRSLAQARELAGRMRTEVADGRDPGALVRVKDTTIKTFRTFAEEHIATHRHKWRSEKHHKQWTATLEKFAFPVIGNKAPKDITVSDVLFVIKPIWQKVPETANRVRQRIESVLDAAAVHEEDYGRSNPARWKGNLAMVLPKPPTEKVHFAAAPYNTVPAIVAKLREKDFLSAYALRFIIATAARSGEARGALWSEIDMKARTWLIPAHRMKAGKAHRVPLNDEAMQVLTKMQEWRQGGAERVFPGVRGGLLSDVAINKALHGIAPGVTVHGFRSAYRVWGAEVGYPGTAMEMSLAHVNRDKVEAAYLRTDLFDKRVEIMDAWCRFCTVKDSNVVQLTPKKKRSRSMLT